jgi:PhnB protein
MAVKPIPEGYRSVTPYLTIEGVARLLEFVKAALDGQERERITGPDGRIVHAEVRIGDSVVMMGEARGDWKPMPGTIYLYTTDADATYKRALKAGATSLAEPANQFYGDRHAAVRDPVGNVWWIATHIEDVSPEEIQKRAKALMTK